MEELDGQLKSLSEIMEDCIHTVQINMLDGPSKSSSKIADGFVLPIEDGLQRTDISLLSN